MAQKENPWLRYPDSPLGEQKRPFEDTFSVWDVLQKTFFPQFSKNQSGD